MVLNVGSLKSNESAPIDCEVTLSVRGVQFGEAAVAFVVFQTPPLTEPT